MRRFCLITLTVLFTLLSASNAQAGWNDFWEEVRLDWRRNNAWPEPFQSRDREVTRGYFAAMQRKGWQLETTVTDYHFDLETQKLTNAGRMKVRWILTQAPPQRRTVYVLLGKDKEQTATRIDSVQQAVASIMPEGPLPAVVQTNTIPRGSSAAYIHDINSRSETSRPDPVLPAGTSSASTSTGTGG